MTHDLVLRDARVMTCTGAGLGLIDKASIVVDRGTITAIADTAPDAREVIDCRGRLVTPGLVDCHTHAIFAGDRANEFAMRAAGASYLDIAAAGGGIAATLLPTRAATDAELTASLDARIQLARTSGTTTMEVKTGYDLTVAGELRLLRLLQRPDVVPTLLAHLIPPERAADRDVFVRDLAEQLIPAAVGLASSVDIYCDRGAFTLAEARAILGAARRAGLAVRAHAGQFDDLGCPELLGELGALSADHLEQVSDAGVAALARAGTVAVMLPGACVQLRLPVPPIERLRKAGVPLAIATDLNPGSSYSASLPIQMWLATTHFAMTVEEAWLGVTRHAARALAIDAGTIEVGKRAALVVWRTSSPADIPYRYGEPLVERVIA